jgi:hypothetical protein
MGFDGSGSPGKRLRDLKSRDKKDLSPDKR